MRTIVDLPEEQRVALARLCEEQRISRAEAIRRAVDRLLKDSASTGKDAAFGLWKDKPISSRKFVDNLRREWRSR